MGGGARIEETAVDRDARAHTHICSRRFPSRLFSRRRNFPRGLLSQRCARTPYDISAPSVNMSVRVLDVLMFLSRQENKQRYQRLEDSADARTHTQKTRASNRPPTRKRGWCRAVTDSRGTKV